MPNNILDVLKNVFNTGKRPLNFNYLNWYNNEMNTLDLTESRLVIVFEVAQHCFLTIHSIDILKNKYIYAYYNLVIILQKDLYYTK